MGHSAGQHPSGTDVVRRPGQSQRPCPGNSAPPALASSRLCGPGRCPSGNSFHLLGKQRPPPTISERDCQSEGGSCWTLLLQGPPLGGCLHLPLGGARDPRLPGQRLQLPDHSESTILLLVCKAGKIPSSPTRHPLTTEELPENKATVGRVEGGGTQVGSAGRSPGWRVWSWGFSPGEASPSLLG